MAQNGNVDNVGAGNGAGGAGNINPGAARQPMPEPAQWPAELTAQMVGIPPAFFMAMGPKPDEDNETYRRRQLNVCRQYGFIRAPNPSPAAVEIPDIEDQTGDEDKYVSEQIRTLSNWKPEEVTVSKWLRHAIALLSLGPSRNFSNVAKRMVLYGALPWQLKSRVPEELEPERVNPNMTARAYGDALREIFEPISESAEAIRDYKERIQSKTEHVGDYVRHRLELFRRAYPHNPDYRRFLRETTNFLANRELENLMWGWVESHSNDGISPTAMIERYIHQVTDCAANIRRLATLGRRSGAELDGVNAHAPLLENKGAATRPVPKPGRINAIGRRPGSNCFWCGKPGHIVADCPARKQGLPKAVQDAPRKPVAKRKTAAVHALLRLIEDEDEDGRVLELAEQVAETYLDDDFLGDGGEEEYNQ